MPRALSLAVSALLALPAAAAGMPEVPAADPPGLVVDWLRPLAGQSAIRCGTHHLATRKSPALACAADAIRRSQPFWVVLDGAGQGPGVWTGIVRNAQGKAWSIRFDEGSTTAGVQRRRSVTVLTCGALAVEGAGLGCVGG